MKYLLAILLFTNSALAQSVIVTDDTRLLAAIERSQQAAIEKYNYVNRDAFNQDSHRPWYERRHEYRDESQVYVDPVAKTYSYKPYRPNVFNVPECDRATWAK